MTKEIAAQKYDGPVHPARFPRVNKKQQLRPAVSLLRHASSKHQERFAREQTPIGPGGVWGCVYTNLEKKLDLESKR
jgi:hypothetical protein